MAAPSSACLLNGLVNAFDLLFEYLFGAQRGCQFFPSAVPFRRTQFQE